MANHDEVKRVAVIDDRGRVFGRFNLIDALVVMVGLGLIPLAYGVFLMFRPPPPKIMTVSPGQVIESTLHELIQPRLQLTGENFRASLLLQFGAIPSPGFLVQDSQHGEVIVPGLPVGVHDLTMFDGGRVLFTMPGALRVVAPDPPVKEVVPPIQTGIALITVRFVAEREVLGVMSVGDVDVGSVPGVQPITNSAVLTDISPDRETASAMITSESVGRNFQIQRPVLIVSGRLRVPVVATPTGWIYRDRPVRVGAPFLFVTTLGAIGGSILDVKIRPQK